MKKVLQVTYFEAHHSPQAEYLSFALPADSFNMSIYVLYIINKLECGFGGVKMKAKNFYICIAS